MCHCRSRCLAKVLRGPSSFCREPLCIRCWLQRVSTSASGARHHRPRQRLVKKKQPSGKRAVAYLHTSSVANVGWDRDKWQALNCMICVTVVPFEESEDTHTHLLHDQCVSGMDAVVRQRIFVVQQLAKDGEAQLLGFIGSGAVPWRSCPPCAQPSRWCT